MLHFRLPLGLLLTLAPAISAAAADAVIWRDNRPQARLVPPVLHEPVTPLIENTFAEYLADSFGWTLPAAGSVDGPGLYVLVGDETNNLVIQELAQSGLMLGRENLGDEGYRLFTHEAGEKRYVIVTANTPAGLKFGCQELLYFHLLASAGEASVEWPLDITRTPAFAYRGTYMLPCWSAHDSLENWKRVLKFHSELTLNRNWFWLSGFPVLKQYGGEYVKSDLADMVNVQGLVELCRSEAMKFYIGGGWYTWHHEKIAQADPDRGWRWYLDLVRALPGAEGIYLEPAGEGSDTTEQNWRVRTEAFERLTDLVWRERPDFEFAIAIGKFNAKAYREAVHQIDQRRIHWWWCWGDPLAQDALAEHPLVLRWHTVVRMSDYHGSIEPPSPAEASLTGIVTSYDPGQGYGNPWNGWGKLGWEKPRNFHPYTMPYFSREYWFRERCWDPKVAREQFAARLQRRLFDADAPAEAAGHYLALADLCPEPKKVTDQTLAPIEAFVSAWERKGTPRQRDTLARMREALTGIRQFRAASQPVR